jgi:hypothetical protein
MYSLDFVTLFRKGNEHFQNERGMRGKIHLMVESSSLNNERFASNGKWQKEALTNIV